METTPKTTVTLTDKQKLIIKLAQARLDQQNNKVSLTPIKEEREERHIVPNDTFTIDTFKNIKSPYVKETIDINIIFDMIKNGTDKSELINVARNAGKGTELYNQIKEEMIPTARFNFNFNGKVSDKNIRCATGLIFIDVDDTIEIDLTNQLIFACWKSISNKGLSILVKVTGLTSSNFSNTYLEISNQLGLITDIGAKKATQQTVLSLDKDLYINQSSFTFIAINEKVSLTPIKRGERERHIVPNDTFEDYTGTTRFNNINEYFEDETPYKVFIDNKEAIMNPFIPKSVIGNRSSNMFSYLSQLAILNPNSNFNFLKQIANVFNKSCFPNLPEDKIVAIVNNVIKKRNENQLIMNKNEERRIIFNPNVKIDRKIKQSISAKEVAKIKTDKTLQIINDCIEDWNFETNGIITQKKIVELTGKSIATVKRNWSNFKSFVEDLNNDITKVIEEPISTEIVSENEDIVAPLDLSTFKCYQKYLTPVDKIIEEVEIKENKQKEDLTITLQMWIRMGEPENRYEEFLKDPNNYEFK